MLFKGIFRTPSNRKDEAFCENESHELFSLKVPSSMLDRVLNTPLQSELADELFECV